MPETYTGPGLVDLQVNGYAGFDFNSDPANWTPDILHRVREAMSRRGVTAALPTFITDDTDRMLARARRYAQTADQDAALAHAFPLLHIEGPFISPEDGPRGAHPRAYCLRPDAAPDWLDRFIEASGRRIGIITVAPELPGALDFIEKAASAGICAALGHTQASPDILAAAISAGARMSTHLGNGSHLMLPRLNNYVQFQLAADALFAGFIADGRHIPFFTLKNFLRAKPPSRSILVTDATAAADAPPGVYCLGGQTLRVREDGLVTGAFQPESGFLAGSSLTLDRAVINVCAQCGIGFEDAWKMASVIPASVVGLPEPVKVSVIVSPQGFQCSLCR
ncbi:MAG: N-acetylglucosamine-6-phosphate deacetylase [bacterium]|nr:N-acetylglucosamine-6-phosphate deacetylase [Candidatus Sumerlaeota bacterium]